MSIYFKPIMNLYFDSKFATNTLYNGSYCEFQLKSQIQLDVTKKYKIAMKNVQFWYNFANISSSFNNNKLRFEYNNIVYTIVFQDGLYNLQAINTVIRNYIEANGDFSPDPLIFNILFQGNSWNGLITMYSTIEANKRLLIDVNHVDNILIKTTLGFTNNTINHITGIEDTFYDYSTTFAKLNNVNSILLHTNIAHSSTNIYNTENNSDILSQINLTVSPNSLQNYEPLHLSYCDLNMYSIDKIIIYLTSENGIIGDINTGGETFQCELTIYETKE